MRTAVSAVLLAAGLLSGLAPRSADRERLTALLDGRGPVNLTLEAPVHELFARANGDEDASVPGTLTYQDPSTGETVELADLEVTVRGHTSRRDSECTFPKLELKQKEGGTLKIGTHCGEAADSALTKYGRLANEKSPWREGLVYRMLEAAGTPVLRTRAARITYVERSGAAPLTRNALLIEDDHDARIRAGGHEEIPMESFGNAAARQVSGQNAGLIAFGEALVGNFDWCLKFAPDDTYRCDDAKPLWNILAFETDDGARLMMKDFDLAGVVVGRHPWFDKVWNPAFVESRSRVRIEVLSQVQRTRSLFSRTQLNELRRHFVERRTAVYAAIDGAPVDSGGRHLARGYADAFYDAVQSEPPSTVRSWPPPTCGSISTRGGRARRADPGMSCRRERR